ncbi:MAG: hypothetical protein KJZ83_01200 [Burkholderiaceae bacterium]|nr:hypothetical protein [Burkholderiaceae bacterium]
MPEPRRHGAAAVASPGYDFASNWSPLPDWDSVRIEGSDVAIATCRPGAMVVVNGDLKAALELAGVESAPVGWPEVARGDCYAVRLARDRALIVGGAALPAGWHEKGFAVSRSEDATIVFAISGQGTGDLLSFGAEVFFDQASASAVRLLAGLAVILYRYGDEQGVRVHVARPRAAALLEWLQIAR